MMPNPTEPEIQLEEKTLHSLVLNKETKPGFQHKLIAIFPKKRLKIIEWWGLVCVFLLNLGLVYPFFNGEDTVNVFSAPLLPVLAEITSFVMPFNQGLRFWLLIFIITTPLSLYFFVKEVTQRKLAGFIASFVMTLPLGLFLKIRIISGLFAGDGAQMASLSIILITCIWLLRFLRQGNLKNWIIPSIGATMVALTSPMGLVTLLCFACVIVFSEMLLGQGRIKALRLLAVVLLTIGFSAFWYNPKFTLLTFNSYQGQLIKKTFSSLLPISFFVVPLLSVFGFLIFKGRSFLQPWFLAIFWTIVFSLLSSGIGLNMVVPSRFLSSLGISVAMLLGLFVVFLFDLSRSAFILNRVQLLKSKKYLANGLIGFIFAVFLMLTFLGHRDFVGLNESQVLGLSSEQRTETWTLRDHISSSERYFGYGLTILSVGGVLILKAKLK